MVSTSSTGRFSDGRSTPSTPMSEAADSPAPNNSSKGMEIAPDGDIVLEIEHEVGKPAAVHSYRVSATILTTHSKYFASLLQPGRFSEAANVEAKHRNLREQYGEVGKAPPRELPALSIKDVGRVAVKSVGPLLGDFFNILHNREMQIPPPVANLANLAVVADRFDALEVVRTYLRRKKVMKMLDAKTTAKADLALGEERVRQRLLVGVLLDHTPWVEKYSLRMICKGWASKEVSVSAALWWDLPGRLEDELVYRRECMLETIQSLQSHFLALYSSRERQCKLGYDSSAQCDSFQLGEMVRFFTRIGTVQLQGTLIDVADPPEPHAGDLINLLDTLRQVPEYQIDKFHSHCGIRTRLVPMLDLLQRAIPHAAVCGECWEANRTDLAWLGAKRPLLWRKGDSGLYGTGHRHAGIRDFFTATERQWS
ncbi:uncharacterized protein LTR77_010692 [Saxophila tyrrhenica]|uniref:BTB domain-containing protein n=1 Tax=Saxophila tyrrhenica TaxID=1690608 RepID=A0AAV9NUV9_9PEZI|nr:hypothetical protein LTR77_010692 [Saxophila tyrrhenica]